jgi:ssDNA-binding Zn-finger/Zn-ribbon topoisomerase 1
MEICILYNKIEQEIAAALVRLEALEKPENPKDKPKEDEDEEEEGTQCPECGHELVDIGNGLLECSGCGQLWENE